MSKQDRRQLEPYKIRQVCARLLAQESTRDIAKNCGLSPNTISKLGAKAYSCGLSAHNDFRQLSDAELLRMFYPASGVGSLSTANSLNAHQRFVPDFQDLARQMLERKLTLRDIFKVYEEQAAKAGGKPLSMSYFSRRIKLEMEDLQAGDDYYFAQDFQYGQIAQIDFSGSWYQLNTPNGNLKVCIMAVTFPASYFCFARFVTGQTTEQSCAVLAQWASLYRVVPKILVCDNAKAWVLSHKSTDVIYNPAFLEFVNRLGMCPQAAPPYHPQRKSAVEYSIMLLQRLADSLEFHFKESKTLAEHNEFFARQVDEHVNCAKFRGSTENTRMHLFKSFELPACVPVCEIPVYKGEFSTAKVPRSYLLTIRGHKYSVPYRMIDKTVEIHVGADYIIIEYEGQEIARHLRQDNDGKSTVCAEHMPKEHQEIVRDNLLYGDPDKVTQLAGEINPYLGKLCAQRLRYGEEHHNLVNALSSCRGMIKTFRTQSDSRIAADACRELMNMPPRQWNTEQLKLLCRISAAKAAALANSEKRVGEKMHRSDVANSYLRYADETQAAEHGAAPSPAAPDDATPPQTPGPEPESGVGTPQPKDESENGGINHD